MKYLGCTYNFYLLKQLQYQQRWNKMPEITRIAPSPTGSLHLGTARTAYTNYLMAKSTGGKFILRIDDTDVERNKDEYTQVILDSLDWLGLEPDEVHYQSQRSDIYAKVAEQLLITNLAKELDNGAIAVDNCIFDEFFTDTISGEISITHTNKEQIEKTILVRGGEKLGQPTYQFTSIIDDYMLGINHIIRGVDHITNTPKQITIWNALNSAGIKEQT